MKLGGFQSMNGTRHTAIIERLDDIARHVRFDWHLFLLGLGTALCFGLPLGPAIVIAWACEFFGTVLLNVAFTVVRALRERHSR
jgi:hypothetical protein